MKRVGEGGMGAVDLLEREQPIHGVDFIQGDLLRMTSFRSWRRFEGRHPRESRPE